VPAEARPAPAKVSRFNLGLAAAVVALVLIGWQWLDSRQHGNALEQDLGRRLAEFDSRNKESQIVAARAQEESRQAMVKLGMLEQKLTESQNQQVALESLYQELSRNRDEWVLAEIEQILADRQPATAARRQSQGRIDRAANGRQPLATARQTAVHQPAQGDSHGYRTPSGAAGGRCGRSQPAPR